MRHFPQGLINALLWTFFLHLVGGRSQDAIPGGTGAGDMTQEQHRQLLREHGDGTSVFGDKLSIKCWECFDNDESGWSNDSSSEKHELALLLLYISPKHPIDEFHERPTEKKRDDADTLSIPPSPPSSIEFGFDPNQSTADINLVGHDYEETMHLNAGGEGVGREGSRLGKAVITFHYETMEITLDSSMLPANYNNDSDSTMTTTPPPQFYSQTIWIDSFNGKPVSGPGIQIVFHHRPATGNIISPILITPLGSAYNNASTSTTSSIYTSTPTPLSPKQPLLPPTVQTWTNAYTILLPLLSILTLVLSAYFATKLWRFAWFALGWTWRRLRGDSAYEEGEELDRGFGIRDDSEDEDDEGEGAVGRGVQVGEKAKKKQKRLSPAMEKMMLDFFVPQGDEDDTVKGRNQKLKPINPLRR